MRRHDDFEDDGRTIADMSDIAPAPTLRPHRRKAAAPPAKPRRSRPPRGQRPKPKGKTDRYAHSRPVKKGKGSFRKKDG